MISVELGTVSTSHLLLFVVYPTLPTVFEVYQLNADI